MNEKQGQKTDQQTDRILLNLQAIDSQQTTCSQNEFEFAKLKKDPWRLSKGDN